MELVFQKNSKMGLQKAPEKQAIFTMFLQNTKYCIALAFRCPIFELFKK